MTDALQTFADPMNNAAPFHYPNTTGIAYSFTDDGYFEEAQYRFLGNCTPRDPAPPCRADRFQRQSPSALPRS